MAGYSRKTAQEQSSRLLLNVMVQDAIQKAMAKRGKRAEISQDRALLNLTRVKLRQGLDFTLRLPYRLSLLAGMIRARMNSKSPTAISGGVVEKKAENSVKTAKNILSSEMQAKLIGSLTRLER